MRVKKLVGDKEHERAFADMKAALIPVPFLARLKASQLLVVSTDACTFAAEAILE